MSRTYPARSWLLAVLLGVVGYALNLLAAPLLPGLQLLFGAVPAFVVAVAFGAGPGALAGAIAGARTVFLWGHPYALVLLALEAATVGLLRARLRPAWAVGVFWLLFGFWAGMISYSTVLAVPWFESTIAILKQVLNGLLNALLAEALLLPAPVRRAIELPSRPMVRQYLGVTAALAAAIPLLSLWILGTRQQLAAALETAETAARIDSQMFARTLEEGPPPPGPGGGNAEIAALRLPGLTLYAIEPNGAVLWASRSGALEPVPARTPGADVARLAVADRPSGTAVYSIPGTERVPFLRNTEQVLLVAQRVGGTAWIVWAEMPFDRILTPLNQRVLTGELVMIAALLLALLLALLVARQLERPIGALVAATQRLAGGDLNARVEAGALVGGPAEPILLAQRLDAMAEQLAQVEEERAHLLDSEREARAEAERRATEEVALRRAAQAVTESYTVEEVIRRIAESALIATSADGAYVERLDQTAGTIVVAAAAGDVHPPLGEKLPLAGSYAEAVLESGHPVLVPDLSSADRPLAGGMSVACPDCAAVVLPLLDSGSAIGALLLIRRGRRGFRPDEVGRAATFANLAALAFRKVHLLEESEQRREELERVMESRARLIRGFSHDLKNPLGAADGYLQLLEEGIQGQLAPKQQESIRHVRRALRAALALIADLVELARAEAGQLDVQLHAVDARDVAREMAGEYRAQAEAAGLALHEEIPDTFPVFRSDDRRVRQVLGNLFSNAVKYTPAGGRIGVRVAMRGGPGTPVPRRWVAIDVWDTGRGIPPERAERIFQEFTRLEPGRTPGAGLGLAISRRVARAIGGELTFVSEAGKGSTFTLWLPLDEGRG